MNKQQEALMYFRNEFNCSQSVLAVFGNEYGITENNCLKIACAFGGGMGRMQHTCGAVTGALMVLGLKYGKGINDQEKNKQLTYAKTREFFGEFKKLNGSVNCRDLLNGLDMNDPDDHKKIIEQKLFSIKCEKYVVDAVRIAEEIMKY
jgi:C_GCAxxG_C_C family probable redox protein